MKACFLEVLPYPQLFLITGPRGGKALLDPCSVSCTCTFPALPSPDLTRQP